jgi:hypothetical protein
VKRDKLLAQYIDAGFVLVPIPAGSKGPTGEGWSTRQNCVETADRLHLLKENVGIAHAYSHTCALDVDDIKLAEPWLRERGIPLADLLAAPGAVKILSGRDGRTKLLYRLPRDTKPLVSRRPADSGLELRCGNKKGTTLQDVLPPSIHPITGNPYAWEGDFTRLPDVPAALLAVWREDIAATMPREQEEDDVLAALKAQELYLRDEQHGKHAIICPWYELHNGGQGVAPGTLESEAVYFERFTNGFAGAGFNCQHASHGEKTIQDLRDYLGLGLKPEPTTFEITDADALIALSPPKWLIKGVIPETGIGAIIGPSGCGKTFLTLNLAGAVALGIPWFNYKIPKAAGVAYILGEGVFGFAMRVRAFIKNKRKRLRNFHVIRGGINICNPNVVQDIAAKVNLRAAKHGPIGLIVIDTLNATMIGDENNPRELGEYLAGMRTLSRECNAFVLVVHHTGKDETRGFRGHSSGLAALDAEITVRRDKESGERNWQISKMRDAGDDNGASFRLEAIEVGKDEDGDIVTSCFVVPY